MLNSISVDASEKNHITLSDFVELANDLAKDKTDLPSVNAEAIAFAVAHEGTAPLQVNDLRVLVTENGFTTPYGIDLGTALPQFQTRFKDVHPRVFLDYLRGWYADPEFLAELLTRHVRKCTAPMLLRLYKDTVRSVKSSGYGAIDNAELLNYAFDFIRAVNPPDFRIVGRSQLDRDALQLTTVWLPSHNQNYGIGVRICNDEVVPSRWHAYPIIKRGSCDNTIRLDDENLSVSVNHSGVFAAQRALRGLDLVFQAALEKAGTYVDAMLEAERTKIAVNNFSKFLSELYTSQGLNKAEHEAALLGTEGQKSVGAVLNGLTWAAHQVADISLQRSNELEALAGDWLVNRQSPAWRAADMRGALAC